MSESSSRGNMTLSQESKKRNALSSKLLTNIGKKFLRMKRWWDTKKLKSRRPWRWNFYLSNRRGIRLSSWLGSMTLNFRKWVLSEPSLRRRWLRNWALLSRLIRSSSKTRTLRFIGEYWALRRMNRESDFKKIDSKIRRNEMLQFSRKSIQWEVSSMNLEDLIMFIKEKILISKNRSESSMIISKESTKFQNLVSLKLECSDKKIVPLKNFLKMVKKSTTHLRVIKTDSFRI